MNDQESTKNGCYVLRRGYLYTIAFGGHKDNDPEARWGLRLGPSCRFQRTEPPGHRRLHNKNGAWTASQADSDHTLCERVVHHDIGDESGALGEHGEP